MSFLENFDFPQIPLNIDINGLIPDGLFLGKGSQAIEIVVFSSLEKPSNGKALEAFKKRRARRATPVLIVITHPEGSTLCGTSGEQPPVYHINDSNQAERLCASALDKPNRNGSIRFLADAMPSLATTLPGIANEGLFSTHELKHGTKSRNDWDHAVNKAQSVLGKSKRELISALGFTIKKIDNLTELLVAGEEETALAVLLNEDESPQIATNRFNDISPISYALTKADKSRLPWVIMVQGDRIRLYNTKNIGVGRRGRTETFIECQTSLLPSKNLGLLWLLFSSEALKENGTIKSILEASKRFASDIADRLRERIYEIVIPQLAMGIAKARQLTNPSKEELELTYEMTLTVLFRLLFVAYAEDRDLFPYKTNEAYRKRSLKSKAIELAEATSTNKQISNGDHHWVETFLVWQSISKGNKDWGLPAYDGTVFSSDASISKSGAELATISLPNIFFEKALRSLLLTDSSESKEAPVDFRSLSVREFGTIYEGLLESELSLATQNLTTDNKGIYIPAKDGDKVEINKGEIYLHNRSGARKSSGSYYTRDFIVEHLLDSALEPAIDAHLEHMSKLSDVERSEQFFDFRIADIAMGSGHFLVASIDRIERRFAMWLEENPVPGITRELQYLRSAAETELGDIAETIIIDDGQLLRRMIARRCIYGVDLNRITVQLSQLSIWIHTFVPGLPLSLLDHNLVNGNALVGVETLDDIRKKFDEFQGTLFEVNAEKLLGKAAEPLRRLAQLSDASVKDIKEGRTLMKEAKYKTLETKALCDLITAQPIANDSRLKSFRFEDWENLKDEIQNSKELKSALEILEPLKAIHLPVTFPEVFLGRTKGFNVILGNPPWEEVKAEERDFWSSRFPGLRNLPQREQIKKWKELAESRKDLTREWSLIEKSTKDFSSILRKGKFPGIEVGDLDLYKAFCWRVWNITSKPNGKIGLVLPRSAFASKGSERFRKALFKEAAYAQVITLTNTGRWIFDMEPRYTIALLSLSKSSAKKNGIEIKGPYNSFENFTNGIKLDSIVFPAEEIFSWSNYGTLPLLSNDYSAEVLTQLRKAPRLDIYLNNKWRARPDTELHATNQKEMMDLTSESCPEGFWPIYKGASYDIWEADTGNYYAWADPELVLPWLQKKRTKSHKSSRDSVHKEFSLNHIKDLSTLSPLRPKIAFRLITRSSDTRTMRVALTPPNVFHSNSSQVVMMTRGDEKDEAFLVGVLSSLPLDWYARRFVEVNFNFFLFNPLPIPRPKRDNPLWQRVINLAGRLACPDYRFSNWASKIGVEFGPLTTDEKLEKIYELDALVAHLYDLSETQLIHIFETFHDGWDFQPRLKEVLRHYHTYSGDK